jgi:hypothetical protein
MTRNHTILVHFWDATHHYQTIRYAATSDRGRQIAAEMRRARQERIRRLISVFAAFGIIGSASAYA